MVRKLQSHCVWLGLLLFTLTIVRPSASRPLYTASTPAKPTAFECGKPNGPCGFDIPANVTCEKGPGWCQPGYYCGRNETDSWGGSSGPELCKPVPKECGKAGHPCCPSNTDAPHGKDTPREQRLPFCRDGSSCFCERLSPPDIYVSPYSGALGRLLQHVLPSVATLKPRVKLSVIACVQHQTYHQCRLAIASWQQWWLCNILDAYVCKQACHIAPSHWLRNTALLALCMQVTSAVLHGLTTAGQWAAAVVPLLLVLR